MSNSTLAIKPKPQPVPLLDLRAQYVTIRDELRDAIDRYKDAADRGAFQVKLGTEGYPQDLEALVKGVDVGGKKVRFLRKVPVDPMTGKDEWRLIHVNAAGQLTDSLVQKPPAAGTNAANNPLGGSQPGGNPGNPLGGSPLGGNQPPAPPNTNAAAGAPDGQPQPVNAAVLRRPSDRPLTPNFGAPNPAFPNQGLPGSPVDPGDDPSKWPAITLPAPTPYGRTSMLTVLSSSMSAQIRSRTGRPVMVNSPASRGSLAAMVCTTVTRSTVDNWVTPKSAMPRSSLGVSVQLSWPPASGSRVRGFLAPGYQRAGPLCIDVGRRGGC